MSLWSPRLCIGLVLLLSSTFNYAETLELDENDSFYDLSPYIEVLDYSTESLTIEEISQASFSTQFKKTKNGNPSFGTNTGTYWARFSLESNDANHPHYFSLEHPIYGSKLQLYIPNGEGGYYSEDFDYFQPLSERKERSFYPLFAIPPFKGKQTFYLRLEAQSVVTFRSVLYQGQEWLSLNADILGKYTVLQVFLLLIVLITGLASIISGIQLLRYYALYLLSIVFLLFVSPGCGGLYLWPEHMALDYRLQLLVMPLVTLATAVYCRHFLQTSSRTIFWDRVFGWLIRACYALILIALVTEMNNTVYVSMMYISSYGLVLTFIGAALKCIPKDRNIIWLVLAMSVAMLTIVYYDMLDQGNIGYNKTWSDHCLLFGIALEMIFLAFGLLFSIKELLGKNQLASQRLFELNALQSEMQKVKADYSVLAQKQALEILHLPKSYYLNPLTERELEILHLLAEGHSNKDMAQQQYVSINTIKFHLKKIYQKLGVGSRVQAISHARSYGLID